MKYTIRSGVFETNSSSMHSFVIMSRRYHCSRLSESDLDTFDNLIDDRGVLRLSRLGDDYNMFGRFPFKVLDNVLDKAIYAIAEFGKSAVKEITKLFRRNVPRFKRFEFPDIEFRNKCGNIDHQSKGMLTKYMNRYNIDLKSFVMDRRYIIIIDGDEYCNYKTLKQLGLLDKRNLDADGFVIEDEEHEAWEKQYELEMQAENNADKIAAQVVQDVIVAQLDLAAQKKIEEEADRENIKESFPTLVSYIESSREEVNTDDVL